MNQRSVEIHIEELILRGFPPGTAREIAGFVEGELSRLFGEHGVPPSLERTATVPYLDAGEFNLTPGSNPQATGAQVAQILYRGFSR